MWLTTCEASTLGAEEVAARLRADLRIGLRWREAELRRQLAGFNELTVREEEPTWKKYIEQVSVRYVVLYLTMDLISHFAFLQIILETNFRDGFIPVLLFMKKCFSEHI
jgi:Ca2+-transporting ATPase